MNITPINAVLDVKSAQNKDTFVAKKQQAPVMQQEQQITAHATAEQFQSMLGIKPPKLTADDPCNARAFLNSHPASPYIKGENRENLIKVMEQGSVETSNVEMQLQLIKEGKLTPQTLSSYWATGKMCDQMEEDIVMMYECAAEGKNVNDVYCPEVQSVEEGSRSRKTGDVFKVADEDMIYVKDDGDKAHQLKMDKETFINLFPPAQRFASAQYAIGDCYCVATLNSVMENPKTRIALYDAIEQDGDDIHVKYPNGKADYVAKDGQLQAETNVKMVMRGAQGMRLLEDAFGLELKVKAEDDFRTIMGQKIVAKEEEYNNETDAKAKAELKKDCDGMKKRLAKFEKAIQNPNNQIVVVRDDLGDKIVYKEDKYGMMFAPLKQAPDNKKEFTTEKEYYRGSLGGYQHQVMEMLGIEGKSLDSVKDRQALLDLLKDEPSGKYMLCGGTWPDGSRTENPVAKDKGVYSFHAYTLEAVKNKDNEVNIRATNPWNTAVDADMTVDEMFKFFQFVEVYDIDSYKGITRKDA